MFEINFRCNKCLILVNSIVKPCICFKCGQTELDFSKIKIKWVIDKTNRRWWHFFNDPLGLDNLKKKVIEVIK